MVLASELGSDEKLSSSRCGASLAIALDSIEGEPLQSIMLGGGAPRQTWLWNAVAKIKMGD